MGYLTFTKKNGGSEEDVKITRDVFKTISF